MRNGCSWERSLTGGHRRIRILPQHPPTTKAFLECTLAVGPPTRHVPTAGHVPDGLCASLSSPTHSALSPALNSGLLAGPWSWSSVAAGVPGRAVVLVFAACGRHQRQDRRTSCLSSPNRAGASVLSSSWLARQPRDLSFPCLTPGCSFACGGLFMAGCEPCHLQ